MRCSICGNTKLFFDNDISARCPNCSILYNLQAKILDYSNGGGQDIPNITKSNQRLDNARNRFQIIAQHADAHDLFIDVGCGSGEMLKASKCFFSHHIGYDTNKILIKHTQKLGLNTFRKVFNKSDSREFNSNGIVLSLNHVLEHVCHPLDMISNIVNNLSAGDLIYIEVPLYTGQNFQTKKYAWSLWYDEHVALYSLKTLTYIANIFELSILDCGYRNFITTNYSRRLLFKNFLYHPVNFVKCFITKHNHQFVLDNIIKDYGFIVLKKV